VRNRIPYRIKLCSQIISHAFYNCNMTVSEIKAHLIFFFLDDEIVAAIKILTNE